MAVNRQPGDPPAIAVLVGLSFGAVHLVDEAKRKHQRSLCDEFCSFIFHSVIMPGEAVCPRCLEIRGDADPAVTAARAKGRLF